MLVLDKALCVIRRAMIVLASEDTVAKRSILPVAWVGGGRRVEHAREGAC